LLFDRRPDEEVKFMEVKSRKPASTAAAGAATGAEAVAAADVSGAEAAVNVLNMEDDDGTEDAPTPDPFEYNTDSED
jgi:26S proteasome regulatory subunit N2